MDEFNIQCVKDYDFSLLYEGIEVSDPNGNQGSIIALANHEKYPAIIIKWSDGSIKSQFHFDTENIFFFKS